jgi:hypothetical protein
MFPSQFGFGISGSKRKLDKFIFINTFNYFSLYFLSDNTTLMREP